jgi:signal transduction histidine kinase
MASKRRIKYQWRLFIPIVSVIWLILICVGIWFHSSERKLRIDNVRSQVALVNAGIIASYEENSGHDIFFGFVERYYVQHPLYDQIRITTYYDGKLLDHVGEIITSSDAHHLKDGSIVPISDPDVEANRHSANFFYDKSVSNDGRLVVYTILPFDADVIAATKASTNVYYLLLVLGILATAFAYFMARRLGHNLNMLRDFAFHADTDEGFIPNSNFPHDELGDISRHIVRLYNERSRYITKIKQEHQVSLNALEEKNRVKRELTNNVNHELKTPISVIKGYLDTIKAHPDMDEASRQNFLDKMGLHVDRLTRLVNDLSKISRLENITQKVATEPINFHEIVYRLVCDYEDSGFLGNLEFNYDISGNCVVLGNVDLLEGIVNNLVKNAVAHSDGTECNLILESSDSQFHRFAFYDNGVGVRPESLPRLFERFFREDSGRSRKTGGTGLGLAIVKNSIEALGGTITAANRTGGGLMYRFTIPRADAKR